MNPVTVTTAGFTLHDAKGRIVSDGHCEHFEEALAESRRRPEVVTVHRVSDCALMAVKPSKKRAVTADEMRVAS